MRWSNHSSDGETASSVTGITTLSEPEAETTTSPTAQDSASEMPASLVNVTSSPPIDLASHLLRRNSSLAYYIPNPQSPKGQGR